MPQHGRSLLEITVSYISSMWNMSVSRYFGSPGNKTNFGITATLCFPPVILQITERGGGELETISNTDGVVEVERACQSLIAQL